MAPPRASSRFLLRNALLLSLLCSIPSPASAKETWVEVRSPNFTVLSNSGEKEARRVADQFEQFRELFHSAFPKFRVDLGKPLVIFAVRNEDSLKLLLPGYWEVKGRLHPDGLYAPGEERHFVALRTDVESENPYQVVYHEYTHALMNLNFRGLPIWLGEGLAEFYGNSRIGDKEAQIGKIASYHLQALQQNKLIPIDALLTAGVDSPYYNEQNRATVFYAESWAIVHYLMMDPDARKRQLLFNFLNAWDASGDQVEAARKTFGDLKKFSQSMEAYARQNTFYVGTVHTTIHGDPKSYSSRELPPAELAAYRALFYVHTQRPNEAHASVGEALKLDSKSPLAYEAQGLLAYTRKDFPAAVESFDRAIELNSSSYFAYYFAAQTRILHAVGTDEEREQVIGYLEKAVAMNPQFAPAYSALAAVYSLESETHDKAFQMAAKAVNLEPGNLNYAINYGYVLLNGGKTSDAKVLSQRIQQAAKTLAEKAGAEALAKAVQSRSDYDKEMAEQAERSKRDAAERAADTSTYKIPRDVAVVSVEKSNPAGAPKAVAPPKHAGEPEYTLEGTISSVDCKEDSAGRLTMTVNRVAIRFIHSGLKGLRILSSVPDHPEVPACSDWKGKRARLSFYPASDKPYAGELTGVQFF